MISPATIEAVRDATDIAAVIGESVRLESRWRSSVGPCPFCGAEPEPREAHGYHDGFHVIHERGFFLCFTCKESGDVIDFVMRRDRVTFAEAVDRLGERAGIDVVWECGMTLRRLVPPPRPHRRHFPGLPGIEGRQEATSTFRKFGRHTGSRP